MRFELDDFPGATIQADIQKVADFDFTAELGGAVHVVFPSWLFSQCARLPGASVKRSVLPANLACRITGHVSRPCCVLIPELKRRMAPGYVFWFLKSGGFRRVSLCSVEAQANLYL